MHHNHFFFFFCSSIIYKVYYHNEILLSVAIEFCSVWDELISSKYMFLCIYA